MTGIERIKKLQREQENIRSEIRNIHDRLNLQGSRLNKLANGETKKKEATENDKQPTN